MRLPIISTALIMALALIAPVALAQEYTVPTTPEYQTPDSGAAPDEDGGDAPADDAPADANAPDTGAGAPGADTAPAGTLPVTGSELPAFLTVFGLVLLLSGLAVRRGARPLR